MNFVVISIVYLCWEFCPIPGLEIVCPKRFAWVTTFVLIQQLYGYTNDPSWPIITLGVLLRILHAQ